MKPKTTIVLFIVAVLIGAFIWYDQTHLQGTEKREEQKKRVFPNLKSSDITRLELRNTNGVVAVEKTADKWDMKRPYPVRASKSDVDAILSDLEFLDAERTMEPQELKEAGATPASYGLDKPRLEATITVAGNPQTLKLGDESKVGGDLYAMVGGHDRVYLLPKRIADTLNKKADDLRDRTVIEFSNAQLNRLELKAGNRQIELTKTENAADSTESWRITRPINARADKTRISDLATKLSDLKVDTFVTEDPKDLKLYGLDDPAQEVTLYTKGSEGAKIVDFGAAPTNDATKVYVRRKPANSIFLVKSDILTNVVLQVNDLRDRKLAEFETDQVKTVALKVGQQAIKLSHGTNEWTLVEPAKLKAEQSACDDFVQHIHDAEIKEFAADVITDLAQFGLDKPSAEITLAKEKAVASASTNEPPKTAGTTNTVAATEAPKEAEPVPIVTIQVGKTDPAKGIVYAKRADEAFVYALATNFAAEFPKGVLDLRDRTIFSGDTSAMQKLEIARGGRQFVTERITIKGTNNVERKEWKLVPPTQGVLAAEAVDAAASSLANIKAERLVADNPSNLAQFGLDAPALVASFTSVTGANAPPQTSTLLVGSESPDKHHFAIVKGNPLVFELDDTTYERLNKEFVTTPEPKPATTNQPPVTASPDQPAPPAGSPPAK